MEQRRKSHYPLEQSCLYKCASRNKLASLLLTPPQKLLNLSSTNDRYRCWDEPKRNGGVRRIEAPQDDLKQVQKRIANLLQAIEPPSYLKAPVKGRSYVDNAAAHIGADAFHLLDIDNFFPSCTSKRVFWFFNSIMNCPRDVAAILTRLTTYNEHLPQGSPCSPILAYFSYQDMWAEIDKITRASGYKLSVYADDITISGKIILGRDVWAIKRCLHKFGHKTSKSKERGIINKAADITGVIVSGGHLLLPNRQHEKLTYVRRAVDALQPGRQKETLKQQLVGRNAQLNHIQSYLR